MTTDPELIDQLRDLLDTTPADTPTLADDFDDILLEYGFDGDPCELLHQLI